MKRSASAVWKGGKTKATVSLDQVGGGLAVTASHLETMGRVSGNG